MYTKLDVGRKTENKTQFHLREIYILVGGEREIKQTNKHIWQLRNKQGISVEKYKKPYT